MILAKMVKATLFKVAVKIGIGITATESCSGETFDLKLIPTRARDL